MELRTGAVVTEKLDETALLETTLTTEQRLRTTKKEAEDGEERAVVQMARRRRPKASPAPREMMCGGVSIGRELGKNYLLE